MVVGHHTGAVVAIEVGASRPDLVRALVLSSAPWTDAEFRLSHADGPGVIALLAITATVLIVHSQDGRSGPEPTGGHSVIEPVVAASITQQRRDQIKRVARFASPPRTRPR